MPDSTFAIVVSDVDKIFHYLPIIFSILIFILGFLGIAHGFRLFWYKLENSAFTTSTGDYDTSFKPTPSNELNTGIIPDSNKNIPRDFIKYY